MLSHLYRNVVIVDTSRSLEVITMPRNVCLRASSPRSEAEEYSVQCVVDCARFCSYWCMYPMMMLAHSFIVHCCAGVKSSKRRHFVNTTNSRGSQASKQTCWRGNRNCPGQMSPPAEFEDIHLLKGSVGRRQSHGPMLTIAVDMLPNLGQRSTHGVIGLELCMVFLRVPFTQ